MVRVARGVGLVGGAIWLLVLPIVAQITGRPIPGVREWHMYAGYGTQICQVEFYRYDQDPVGQIDRVAALSAAHLTGRPALFLASPAAVNQQAATLCRVLDAQDVRAVARCASRTTWQKLYVRENNLCRSGR